MATRRIQDLENIEEVLPDSIIPIGESTKTKSMLVSQLKKWLSNFFVGKTGREDISGVKTFNDDLIRRETFSGASPYTIRAIDNNGKGSIAMVPYYINNAIYNRMQAENTISGKKVAFDIIVKDNGTSSINSNAIETIAFMNAKDVLIPTPTEDDNSQRAINALWVNSNLKNKLIPNTESLVNIVTAISSTDGYIAPSGGFVSVQTNVNGATTILSVNGQVVAQAHQYSGDSHGSESKQLFTLVGKGQVVKTDRVVQFGVFVPFK